jgi:Tfp pilus assembly protein PilV
MTLVELLMSMVMLVVAVGGLVGSSAAVARQLGSGMSQTVAASMAQARLDSLTSLSCAELAAGAAEGHTTDRGVSEEWRVIDGRNIKTIEVAIELAQRSTPLAYRMIVPCRD